MHALIASSPLSVVSVLATGASSGVEASWPTTVLMASGSTIGASERHATHCDESFARCESCAHGCSPDSRHAAARARSASFGWSGWRLRGHSMCRVSSLRISRTSVGYGFQGSSSADSSSSTQLASRASTSVSFRCLRSCLARTASNSGPASLGCSDGLSDRAGVGGLCTTAVGASAVVAAAAADFLFLREAIAKENYLNGRRRAIVPQRGALAWRCLDTIDFCLR